MTDFFQLIVTGLAIGAIYSLVAMGLVIIYKSSGVLNVAQGEILMLMAFICYSLSVQLGLSFYLAAILTLMFAGIIGLLIEVLLLRRMIGQPMLGVIMMTIGLSLIMKSIPDMIWGAVPVNYPAYLPKKMIHIFGIIVSPDYLYGFVVCMLFFIGSIVFFRYLRVGIAMRAVADDQTAAQSMGVNIKRVFGTAWAISCLVAAAGGIILGTITSVSIALAPIGLKAWPVIIVGGLESMTGAIVGGLAIGVMEGIAGGYLDQYISGIKDVFPFLTLLIILFIKPYGLFGLKRIERL